MRLRFGFATLRSDTLESAALRSAVHRPALALVLAAVCTLVFLLAGPAPASARAHASTRSVNEWGALKLKSSRGANILEQGYGWGSFKCGVRIILKVSGTLVTASYLAYPHGGSIAGAARAYIRSASKNGAYYSGTIWLHGGTGSYRGAAGRASFSGTIDRKTYAMSVHIAGRVRL